MVSLVKCYLLYCRIIHFVFFILLSYTLKEQRSQGQNIHWYESRHQGRGCWERSLVPPFLHSLQTAPHSEKLKNGLISQRSLRCWSDHTWGETGRWWVYIKCTVVWNQWHNNVWNNEIMINYSTLTDFNFYTAWLKIKTAWTVKLQRPELCHYEQS